MIKLSIIVPVYNVEEYIRPCFESIFKQGLDEECFEVIIVNDGTKDRSMEMIQDIIEQKQRQLFLVPQRIGSAAQHGMHLVRVLFEGSYSF